MLGRHWIMLREFAQVGQRSIEILPSREQSGGEFHHSCGDDRTLRGAPEVVTNINSVRSEHNRETDELVVLFLGEGLLVARCCDPRWPPSSSSSMTTRWSGCIAGSPPSPGRRFGSAHSMQQDDCALITPSPGFRLGFRLESGSDSSRARRRKEKKLSELLRARCTR